MQRINLENWTYCRFHNENFKALITFGANPDSVMEDQLEYYVTVIDKENIEIFQESFNSLSSACLYINENYSDWKFEDQTATKSGCSSCAAH